MLRWAMRSSAEFLTHCGGLSAVWRFWSVRLGGADGTRRKTQYCFFDRPPEVCLSSIGRRQCLTPLGFGKGEGRAPSGIEQHGGKSPGIRARQSTGWHVSYFSRGSHFGSGYVARFPLPGPSLSPTNVSLASHIAGKRPRGERREQPMSDAQVPDPALPIPLRNMMILRSPSLTRSHRP